MKKPLTTLLAALLIGSLAGCQSPAQSSETTVTSAPQSSSAPSAPMQPASALLEEINRTHQAVTKPQVNFADYTRQASDDSFDIAKYMVDMSADYGKDFVGDAPLTSAQAREDLDVLFRALQTTYGAYYYFGGDKAFGEAKEMILQKFEQSEKQTCSMLVTLLLENLSFIQDGHFRIVGMASQKPSVGFLYRTTAFDKSADGFSALESEKAVTAVDGWDNLDALFRRSIADDGRPVYYPVILSSFDYDNPQIVPPALTVHYSDGSSESLTADPFELGYEESEATVELRENQGIPVLFVRNMGFDEAKDDTLGRDFLAYAAQLKDEPAVILDLRSNGGGNNVLPFKWLQAYTGQPVTTNYQTLKYWTMEAMEAYAANEDNAFYVSRESMVSLAGYEPISDHYMKTNAQPDVFVENDKLLVVLTGKNTASAAETFTDLVHNISNTLTIGQNTYGMLVSNAYVVIALPNSHAPIQFGSDLSLFPEDPAYFQEFVGFQPDLWTNGDDAEELAVRLVKQILAEQSPAQ